MLQSSFNYERMQATGFLYGMETGLKKIYKGRPEALTASMHMHMEFYNMNPFVHPFNMGLALALEEKGESLDTVRNIKLATMGPLAGIGDAMVWFTFLPITAGIGASMAISGNFFGPILFLLIFNAGHFSLMFFLTHYSYRLGVEAVSKMTEKTKYLARGASIVGCFVIGALIASYVHLSTTVAMHFGNNNTFSLQKDFFDKLAPDILPFAYVLFMYWLLKKGWSSVLLILLSLAFALVAHLFHII